MWGLFELLKLSFSSLIWGVLITILCLVLFFVLIKGWYRSATFTPLSYLIGAVLFLFLSFQSTMIVGGLKINSLSQEYYIQIESLVNHFYDADDSVSTQVSTKLVDKLIRENPILKYYIGWGEFSGYTASQLPQAVVSTLQTYIRWYIVRRLLWCLFFVGVGAFVVIRSMAIARRRPHSYVGSRASRPVRTPYSRGTGRTRKGF